MPRSAKPGCESVGKRRTYTIGGVMKSTMRFGLALALSVATIHIASAQQSTATTSAKSSASRVEPATSETGAKDSKGGSLYRPQEINHIRPANQRGLNVFEPPKEDAVP